MKRKDLHCNSMLSLSSIFHSSTVNPVLPHPPPQCRASPPPQRSAPSERKPQWEPLWLNALWLLAANSPLSPLGWPLLWTYEPCHSVWHWEMVQGLLIKYYSPLNGWRLASVGMLVNLPPGQMCACISKRACVCVCVCVYVCVCVGGYEKNSGE